MFCIYYHHCILFSTAYFQYCITELRRCRQHMESSIEQQRRHFDLQFEKLQQQNTGLKRRQEQIFVKQDQIQSTLHGETPLLQSPTSSVVVYSPPFTNVSDGVHLATRFVHSRIHQTFVPCWETVTWRASSV